MKTSGEKLYDACRLWNLTEFVPWLDAPIELRDQMDKIADTFSASLSGSPVPCSPHMSAEETELIDLLDEYENARLARGRLADAVAELAAFRIAEHYSLIRKAIYWRSL